MTTHQLPRSDEQLQVVALELADDLSEVATVRAWAERLLADLPDDRRRVAVWVVEELATNALRHGEPPRQVRLLRRPGWLGVEVDDGCLDTACVRRSGGGGLRAVAAVSVTWGQWQRSTGKTVWAEIALPV
ncbi:ATP-binding protein [Amycolatopsis sp. NPDC098790]|uniref:ATP-binding protein n=1 Tax=Amycolatopsis sp. NPDC098790 TaxID=3363939 RepID=UPI003821BEA5